MNSYNEFRNNYINAIPLKFNTFYNNEYNNIRRLKLIVISHTLGCYSGFKTLHYDQQTDIIKHIENSCANECIRKSRGYNIRCVWDNNQFIDIYHSVSYNIISVLSQENNTLIKKILENTIDLDTIATLSCKELSPEIYDDISREITKRVNTSQTQKYTEMHFCKKCKRNQTTAERVQNRSGDEASSFFITCLFCGMKWFK